MIQGVPVSGYQKQQFTSKKDRILGLELDVEPPAYTAEGEPIHTDLEDDMESELLNGIFNWFLLDYDEWDR